MRLASVLVVMAAATAAPAAAQQRDAVTAVEARIDVDRGFDFVFAEAVGEDVRVRWVRMATVNDLCPIWTVEALERTLPRTTVQAVVDVAVCRTSERAVRGAIERAPDHRGYVDFLGRVDALVAHCPRGDRTFVFAMPPNIDRERLKRQDPAIERVWDVGSRLRALVVGRYEDYYLDMPREGREAREQLGTALLPMLRRSSYDTMFAPLADYTGPPAVREPDFVDVVGLEGVRFASYREPYMPQIAQSARVFGDVRATLVADASGAVRIEVDETAPPLLRPAVVDAARTWRVAGDAVPAAPVPFTVRFHSPCAP